MTSYEKKMGAKSPIVVIGAECIYPGSSSIDELWPNIMNLRQEFRPIPTCRLNPLDYHSDHFNHVDKTYLTKGSFLTNYTFDFQKFKIPKSTYDQTDLTHWLALDVTDRLLTKLGLPYGEGIDKSRTGVIIGNSLTGEFSRANIMRLRWPYVKNVLSEVLERSRLPKNDIDHIMAETLKKYKQPFPPPDSDMLAGGLSNVIAGRICNYYDFQGGGFTVDGACSSSLLAITQAYQALTSGAMDYVITGGVDLSIDPFEVIGFSRNSALSKTRMRVFDERSDGFWPGEGCGMALMTTEENALKAGLKPMARLAGWGMSSDGSGGVTRPKAATQALALQRAYEMAGYPITSVDYFEGHGTGTSVGDTAEISGLVSALSSESRGRYKDLLPRLGSIKELIGHTKAAAGIAGFIKACLVVQNRVIPPGIPTDFPNKALDTQHLQLAQRSYDWKYGDKLRASVSAMGFGGINVHMTLTEYDHEETSPVKHDPSQPHAPYQDYKIFPFKVGSPESLVESLNRASQLIAAASYSEFHDYSNHLCQQETERQGQSEDQEPIVTAALVSDSPDDLLEKISHLIEKVPLKQYYSNGIFYDRGDQASSEVGFIFPGQGSSGKSAEGVLAEYLHPEISILKPKIHNPSSRTDMAQPLLCWNALVGISALQKFGIRPFLALGHSLGELCALNVQGAISPSKLMALSAVRGDLMSQSPGHSGMLAVKCPQQKLTELIHNRNIVMACINGSEDFVLSGCLQELKEVQKFLLENDGFAKLLNVSHGFHSPFMNTAKDRFRSYLDDFDIGQPKGHVISTVKPEFYHKDWNMRDILSEQLTKPVRFSEAIAVAKNHVSAFIEVGPNSTLSQKVEDQTNKPCVGLNIGSNSYESLLDCLALGFVHGKNIDFGLLYQNRNGAVFKAPNSHLFLENPCEKQLSQAHYKDDTEVASSVSVDPDIVSSMDHLDDMVQRLKRAVSKKSGLDIDSIRDEFRLMSDLHMNSLTVMELIREPVKHFSQVNINEGLAIASSDGTLKEIASSLFQSINNCKVRASNFPKKHWTHGFENRLFPLKSIKRVYHQEFATHLIIANSMSCESSLVKKLGRFKIGHQTIIMTDRSFEELDLVLKALKTHIEHGVIGCFSCLQLGQGLYDIGPILKTASLESPKQSFRVINIPEPTQESEECALNFLSLNPSKGFHELKIDPSGNPYHYAFEPVFPRRSITDNRHMEWSSDDVILATGGAKGITFECVKALSLKSGCRLALIGRSQPKHDPKLQRNLEQLTTLGVEYAYFSANIADLDAVQKCLSRVKTRFGKISGFIHGAGLNQPKKIQHLTLSDIHETKKPKCAGFDHILAQLNLNDLRFLIGFTSIIGQTGLEGEAHYAYANNLLAAKIEDFDTDNHNCLAYALDWSVWLEAGMGEDLGVMERLESLGVSGIPLDKGVQWFMELLSGANQWPVRLAISGRYGNIPTFNMKKNFGHPSFRFQEEFIYELKGVETIYEFSLDVHKDPYLLDHVFQGHIIFPAVMLFEAMTQITSRVLGLPKSGIQISNAHFHKPIIIPRSGPITVRVYTLRLDHDSCQVEVFVDSEKHMESRVRFGDLNRCTKPIGQREEGKTLQIDVDQEFYQNFLFHENRFRRIEGFNLITPTESKAVARGAAFQWFHNQFTQRLLLGDPGLNDASIHCHQACIPHKSLLPKSFQNIEIYESSLCKDSDFWIETRQIQKLSNGFLIDVVLLKDHKIILRYDGLLLEFVSGSDFKGQWPKFFYDIYNQHQQENTQPQEGVDL